MRIIVVSRNEEREELEKCKNTHEQLFTNAQTLTMIYSLQSQVEIKKIKNSKLSFEVSKIAINAKVKKYIYIIKKIQKNK